MSGSRRLDDWIEAFVKYTDNTEPPESYRRWVAISTMASALQRKCKLDWGSETFFPNMYIVLVGPPAARKGTAMRTGKDLLDQIGIAVSADESSRQKLVKSLQEMGVADQDDLGRITFHSSMTLYSSELTVFLGYGAKELLAMLCKWYDCEPRYVYDTLQRGKEEVPNVWCNLMGATTPGQLQASLPEDAVGSGFTSRVVFVYEHNKGKLVRKPTLEDQLLEPLLHDLGRVRNLSGDFTVLPDAEDVYYDWYEHSEDETIFTDYRMEYYVQRRPTHLFKLSMIISAARGDDKIITPIDLKEAIKVLEGAEKNMSQVFAGVGANPLAGIQFRILNIVRDLGPTETAVVAEALQSDASFSQFGEAIQSLEQMGHIKIDIIKKLIIPVT
jgi:hypothetical protein